jgi:hypothetical protein
MNPQTIDIELTGTFHRWAKLFASKQLDVPRGRQVYLNTLSILAIEEYLHSMGIATDIESSRSWYPTPLNQPADLQLVDLGSIAAIAVSLNDALDSAAILGFLPVATIDSDEETIDLTELHPIADLPNYLGKIRDGYGLIESDADNEIVTALLAEINERCILRFIAESYQIVTGDRTPKGKHLAMEKTIDSAYAISDVRRHTGVTEAEELDRKEEIGTLAAGWLNLLSNVWTK